MRIRLQDEVEHAAQKGGIPGTSVNAVLIGSAGREEDAEQLRVAGKPLKGLKCNDFGLILMHGPRLWRRDARQGFVNLSQGNWHNPTQRWSAECPDGVLLVADLATNRIALKAKLSHACYEVIQAAGGVEAMVAARRESPDVIVMDARMPGIDGIACCAQLGADPATRSVPVVLVAASGDRAAALQGLAAGAEDILHHPIDEAALLARMRNLMREKAMRDELAMRSQTCRALGLAEEAAARRRFPRQRCGSR
jgi:CheY-like chemotaxis protein